MTDTSTATETATSNAAPKPFHPRRILVSGASGMIGTELVANWMRLPVHPVRLVRSGARPEAAAAGDTVVWDPYAPRPFADRNALAGVDAAIHLSGANVAAGRWTEKYKREIVSSRVQTTQALAAALSQLNPLPKVLVCASAIGIYGNRGDELLTEGSTPGTGFLAETCIAWEAAARVAAEAGIRVVHARFGVVLSPKGGAMAKLLPLFRLGLGGNLGDGKAWMPWITLRDAANILNYCVENESVQGAINAVSPNANTNADFTKALGAAVHRPAIVAAPAFALRLAFGEMANEALLASTRVVPAKLIQSGYQFADPEIGAAMRGLLC